MTSNLSYHATSINSFTFYHSSKLSPDRYILYFVLNGTTEPSWNVNLNCQTNQFIMENRLKKRKRNSKENNLKERQTDRKDIFTGIRPSRMIIILSILGVTWRQPMDLDSIYFTGTLTFLCFPCPLYQPKVYQPISLSPSQAYLYLLSNYPTSITIILMEDARHRLGFT